MGPVVRRGRRSDRDVPPTAVDIDVTLPGQQQAEERAAVRRVQEERLTEGVDLRGCDAADADAARRSYRAHGMRALSADERIAPILRPGELVHAIRREATLDRRQPPSGSAAALAGDLYVTSDRVILLGRPTVILDIEKIREAGLSGDRLLLVMKDGTCAALAVEEPRLLRVQIAAARAARRRSARVATNGVPDDD